MTAPTTITTTTDDADAGGAGAGADGGIHSDQASVLSRSTITTASNSNLTTSVSSVREKARRRWEQNRTANQRMKWRQQAAKSASADRQRPHEKAAEEEHERMLVEKASRKLQERARMEKERLERQQQEQQQELELERGASNGTSTPTDQQKEHEEEEEEEQEDVQEEQTLLNSREEEQEEAVVRALARQRQQKQRQQQRRLAQAKAVGAEADASANAAPASSMNQSIVSNASGEAMDAAATMEKKGPAVDNPPSLPSSAESSFASSSSSSTTVSPSTPLGPERNRDRVNTESSAVSAAISIHSCATSRPSLPPDYADAASSSSVDASTLPPPPPPPRRNKPNNITKRLFVSTSTKRSAHPSPFKFRQGTKKAAQRKGASPSITSSKTGGDGRHDRSGSSIHSSSTVNAQGSSKSSSHLDDKTHTSKVSPKEPRRRPVEPPSPPPPPPPSRPVAPRPDASQQQRPEEKEMERNQKQAPPTSKNMSDTDSESGLGIQWKISEEGNGELSFEDLRSLSIDDLRTKFGDGASPRESRAGSPAEKANNHEVSANVDEANARAVEKTNGTTKDEKLALPNKEIEVEDAGIRAACIVAEEARSHVDRSIDRWEKHSGCDPPDDDTSSRHNVKRRADPPAGDEFDNNGASNKELNQDEAEAEAGGVTFVKVGPESEQSKPFYAVGNADNNDNAAVSNGLQNLNQIAEIRARETTNTHGTVCSRSVVSELTYDDHLSVATGHISHFSMSPSELEEEAAEIEAMEAARLTGHSIHHRILPCVKEESPSEAFPDATPSLAQSPAAPVAVQKKTKIADTTLYQLLKEAQDLTEMVDDTELDVTQDDTTREEDRSQITNPAILAEMKEIQASIDYTQSQLSHARNDVDKQIEMETELLGEVHELLRAFGVSDPLASRRIEDEACSALKAEEEARIALVRSERECKWTQEDSANKADTESKLRTELRDLRKQLADVDSKTQKEESVLLKRVKLCEEEESILREEHNRLQKKLKEITAHTIPAGNRSGEMDIKSSPIDDKDSSTVGGLMNRSVVTEGGTSSQPFDELAGLSTELSMIIDEQVGVAMAVNENSISAMSEEEAKATLQEMETRVAQFEQTIEQLEQAQGKIISPITDRQAPQPPSLSRVLSSPTDGSTVSIDRQNLENAQIVQSSSPLKEEYKKMPPKEEEAESRVPKKRPDDGDCSKVPSNPMSCQGKGAAEWTLSKEKETDATKDTSFTMSDAVTDMNLNQFFVPGTPKRLAKKVWRASPKRKALGTPKRALGLTSSVIEINADGGDQDTVSSIGSRDIARIAPDTPQRFKCHQNCGLLDSINTCNFWGKQGIPEGDEEEDNT